MKKLWAIFLVVVLALALAIPMAVPVAAASSATLDPAWQVTQNRLSKSILPDGLNSALPSSDIAWGGFTTPVWTGGSTGIPPYSNAIPYWISGDTWLGWTAQPQNWITHTDAWLKTSINIPATWIVSSVKLVEKYKPSILSINDDLYVYVDGTYCAGGGTAGVPLVQGMIGTTPPDPSPYGTFVAALGVDWTAAPITGWYLNGGLSLPASLFTAGNHEIQILAEEFDESGGIAHPVFLIEYTEVTLTTLTPPEAYNLVGTTHTVYATIVPSVADVPITFEVSGANTASGTENTNGSGVAEFTYTGTNPGQDTITATLGDVTLSVTKYWFEHFVTGGGNITEGRGNTAAKITFGGNVGFTLEGDIVGQWNIVFHNVNNDAIDKGHFHTTQFTELYFGNVDACPEPDPPDAEYNYAHFVAFGEFNGVPGWKVRFNMTDYGEGKRVDPDGIRIRLYNTSNVVVYDSSDSGSPVGDFPNQGICATANRTWLDGGNIQIHPPEIPTP